MINILLDVIFDQNGHIRVERIENLFNVLIQDSNNIVNHCLDNAIHSVLLSVSPQAANSIEYNFSETFRENINPSPVKNPELVILNKELANTLSLDFSKMALASAMGFPSIFPSEKSNSSI